MAPRDDGKAQVGAEFHLGRLQGAVDGLADRIDGLEEWLKTVDGKLDLIGKEMAADKGSKLKTGEILRGIAVLLGILATLGSIGAGVAHFIMHGVRD